MSLKNLENLQTYTAVTSALLKDQQVVSHADALKNVPGVIKQLENATGGGRELPSILLPDRIR